MWRLFNQEQNGEKMKVLSLFDGMSCGQIALERAGIPVDQYYASELDKHAIKVTQANYPETVQLGDVTKWREWDIDWSSIDLLIGGSPCQGFSFAGKQLAFDDPRSKLFFVYVEILNHIRAHNPAVHFMLENVKMKKEHLAVISEHLGVEPVFINSALLSAQSRQRYYWASWEFGQPEDKGIVLADILESDAQYRSAAIRGRYIVNGKRQDGKMSTAGLTQQMLEVKSTPKSNSLTTVQKDTVISPLEPGSYPIKSAARRGRGDEVRKDDKANALLSDGHQSRWLAKKEILYRKLTPTECERLQTVPDGYTAHVSNTQRYQMLGNGWTVDVVAHIFRSMPI